MKYYSIESSQNRKILGKIPQVKEFIHHCNVLENPNFIDNFTYKKIEIEPILSNVLLFENAKQTDLIDTFGDVGFVNSYLVSNTLKEILDKFNCFGFQFFKTFVMQGNEKNYDYWVIYRFDFPYQFIDLKKTKFFLKSRDINRNPISESINFDSIDELLLFENTIRYPKMISIEDLFLKEDINLDLFSIRYYKNGGVKGIVSERLKNEIEKQGITGIEFKPLEMPYNEWLTGGEREKIYGKAL